MGQLLADQGLLLHRKHFRQSRHCRQRRPRMPKLGSPPPMPTSRPPTARISLPSPQGLFADIAPVAARRPRPQAGRAGRPAAGFAAGARPDDRRGKRLTTWTAIPQNGTPEQYRDYLEKFPNGVFAKLARLRLEAVSGEGAADVAALPDKITARYEEFADDPLYPEVNRLRPEAGHVQEIADPAVGVYSSRSCRCGPCPPA